MVDPTTSIALATGLSSDLAELYRRGTPENTLRAWERDLAYISAWRILRFGDPPVWPEREDVALAFLLDHARDLQEAADQDPARLAAENLIASGLRRQLSCPAAATLDRRIASWRAFHRIQNLTSPFDLPLIRQARQKARRAADRPPSPKSANPVTRETLLRLVAATGPDMRGLRDRAILLLAWGSGGRRRSEIVSLNIEDLDLREFDRQGHVWIRLRGTKTTRKGTTPKLVLKGRVARSLVAWLDDAGIQSGPVFRPVSKSDRVLKRRLTPEGVASVLRRLIRDAGLPEGFASPHGLRSGFLTQAALDGAPLQAAMQLSLHRSAAQAQKYYADVDIAENPATNLLGD